jgi:hypothetical protein
VSKISCSLAFLLIFSGILLAEVPDAPSTRSNWKTITNKTYLATAFGDLAATSFDIEMSKEGYAHHRCVEGGAGLPKYPTRGQLYRHELPENLFAFGFGFLLTKFKAPRWLMPIPVAYPIQAHIRAGLGWYEHCW